MHQEISTVRTKRSAVLKPQLPAIRSELDEQRSFRIEQLEMLRVDAVEAAATADEPRLQIIRVLEFAAEWALSEIDAALQRLADGSYGICEHCGEQIPWERLDVLPETRFCSPCQIPRRVGQVPRARCQQARSGQWNPVRGR
jgi:RNA polymerase-binding transcription factor